MNFSQHGCSPVTMVTSQIFKSHMYLWQSRWRCSFPGRCCLCWVCNTRTSPDLQTGASGWPAGPYRPSPSPPSPRRFSPGAETEHKGSPCLWWTPRPSASRRNRLCTETTQSPACGGLRTPRRNRAGRGGSLQRGTRVRLELLRPDTQRTGALQKKKKKSDRVRDSELRFHWQVHVGHFNHRKFDATVNILSWWLANEESIH